MTIIEVHINFSGYLREDGVVITSAYPILPFLYEKNGKYQLTKDSQFHGFLYDHENTKFQVLAIDIEFNEELDIKLITEFCNKTDQCGVEYHLGWNQSYTSSIPSTDYYGLTSVALIQTDINMKIIQLKKKISNIKNQLVTMITPFEKKYQLNYPKFLSINEVRRMEGNEKIVVLEEHYIKPGFIGGPLFFNNKFIGFLLPNLGQIILGKFKLLEYHSLLELGYLLYPIVMINEDNNNNNNNNNNNKLINNSITECICPIYLTSYYCWGTGVLIQFEKDIYCLTNQHLFDSLVKKETILTNEVIQNQVKIQIQNQWYNNWKLIYYNPSSSIDIIILKFDSTIDIKLIDWLGFINIDKVYTGDKVVSMGYSEVNPIIKNDKDQLKIENGVINSIIKMDNRNIMYVTNCKINCGGSGGGLFNQNGQLLGLITKST
ncbi:hypothetical protein K502DRAFT_329538 [Neoconidiobolus thromboides FSU 785]|nr:hypothetical protein K502DRAFT_329538 [Neoconidiobolus thromboides FSU 785]